MRQDYLFEKIREIQQREQNAVLPLVRGGHVISIHFEKGLISAVNSNNPQHRLGNYLLQTGVLDRNGLNQLVQDSRKHRMFIGQAAVKKLVIDVDNLIQLIQQQMVDILAHVLSEEYEVRPINKELLEYYLPAKIDLPHLMLLIARKCAEPFHPAPGKLVVLKSETNLTHLPWYPEELAVLGMLKNPRRLQEIQSVAGVNDYRLNKILSVLDDLNLIEFVEAPDETTTAIVKRHGFPFGSLVPQLSIENIDSKLEAFLDINSFVSEQFKCLKVRMTSASFERPVKVITVTSADNEAGKSLISINLAASFSKDFDRKTIIMDCDFRRPSLHRLVGTSIEPGLIGYLKDDLQSFCYMRRLENLFVMTAGGTASNPVEILSMEKMRDFIQYLRSEFDTIILDAPPLTPISDTLVLEGLSDGMLLVVRSGKTSFASIERAARNLDEHKMLGIVLNDVPPLMFNTHHEPVYYEDTRKTGSVCRSSLPNPAVHLKKYLDD
jgi:capsular exopolysaccharide synthesis family protein